MSPQTESGELHSGALTMFLACFMLAKRLINSYL